MARFSDSNSEIIAWLSFRQSLLMNSGSSMETEISRPRSRYVRYAPGSLNQDNSYIPMQFCTCNHTGPLALMN